PPPAWYGRGLHPMAILWAVARPSRFHEPANLPRAAAHRRGGGAAPRVHLGIRRARQGHTVTGRSTERVGRPGILPLRTQPDVPERLNDRARRGAAGPLACAPRLLGDLLCSRESVCHALRGTGTAAAIGRVLRPLPATGGAVAAAAAKVTVASLDSFSTARLRAERLTAAHFADIRAMDRDAKYMALLGGPRSETE